MWNCVYLGCLYSFSVNCHSNWDDDSWNYGGVYSGGKMNQKGEESSSGLDLHDNTAKTCRDKNQEKINQHRPQIEEFILYSVLILASISYSIYVVETTQVRVGRGGVG